MAPIWYSSSGVSVVLTGVPMSGRSSATLPAAAAWKASREAQSVTMNRDMILAALEDAALDRGLVAAFALAGSLQDIRGVVGQAGALPAHQRDMSGMRPAAEGSDHVSEARRRLGEVRGIDLRDVAQADECRPWSGAGHHRLHLLGTQVLRFIDDDEAVQEGAAAHEVE